MYGLILFGKNFVNFFGYKKTIRKYKYVKKMLPGCVYTSSDFIFDHLEVTKFSRSGRMKYHTNNGRTKNGDDDTCIVITVLGTRY